MEPPTPNIKSKEYTLKTENRTFQIKLYLSSDITIEANELNRIKGIFYSGKFSLDELVKLSRGFKICEDIKEAYDAIVQIFENKKALINDIKDNEISIIIKVDLLGGKVQDVTLTLNKKKMNDNAIIEELVKKVNQLEEENKSLKKDMNNKVNQLEEENKSLKKDIKDIKEKFNLFEKYFADEIKYKKIKEELGIDSKIIKQKEDLEFLTKRLINNDENLKQKKINYNLIYRATRDGDSLNSFHSRVDNKRSHLSIIETNKGLKFGVFIEQPLKHANKLFNDNKSFVFSLNLKKIYNAKYGANNINDVSEYLIDLYNQPILIVENCLSNNKSYTCSKSNADYSYTGFEKNYELNNKEPNFQVKEMETFLIEFK